MLSLAGSILFSSCASTTLIKSEPSGAKLYLNGEPVGNTPYSHRDTKVVGSTTLVRMEMEGYETLHASFSRNEEADVGAIIGGVFVLVPFLWTLKYKPEHTYELKSLSENEPVQTNQTETTSSKTENKSKAERLREFKQLLDEEIITQEEFEKEKEKILNEGE